MNLILAVILAGTASLVEPDATRQHIGVGVAVGSHQIRDEALNPTTYRDVGPAPEIFWSLDGVQGRHEARLGLALLSELHNRFDPAPVSVGYVPSLRYQYTHDVAALPWNGRLFVGGGLGADARIYYLPLWDDSHFYWLTDYSLAACAQAQWSNARDQTLRASLRIPAVALVSRPEALRFYKLDDPSQIPQTIHRDLRLASPIVHQEVDVALDYVVPLTKRLELGLSGGLGFVRSDLEDSAVMSHVTRELVLSSSYRF